MFTCYKENVVKIIKNIPNINASVGQEQIIKDGIFYGNC